jgi:hypothetical protein
MSKVLLVEDELDLAAKESCGGVERAVFMIGISSRSFNCSS